MATFVEQALGRRAQAQQAQDRPAPAPTPNFAQYRQIRTSEFGDADQWGDDIEDRVAQEYKQTYLPALASQMGLGARPKQEQIDGLGAQFDAAHAQMKQRKAAALGVPTPEQAKAAADAEPGMLSDAWESTKRGIGTAGTQMASAVNLLAAIPIEAGRAGLGMFGAKSDTLEGWRDDVGTNLDALGSLDASIRESTLAASSKAMQENQRILAEAGPVDAMVHMATSPSMWVEYIPQMLLPAGAGATVGRKIAKAGVERAATTGMRVAGATPEMIKGAKAAALALPTNAAKVLKGTTTGAIGGTAASAGGAAALSTRDRFAQMVNDPVQLEKLVATEDYQEALASNGGDHEKTLRDLQMSAGYRAAAASATINAAIGLTPIGRTIESTVGRALGGSAGRAAVSAEVAPIITRLRQAINQPGSALSKSIGAIKAAAGSNVGRAAVSEGLTEAAEQFASNVALYSTGLEPELSEGVLKSGLVGGVIGSAIAGPMDLARGGALPADPNAAPPASGTGPLDPNAPPPPTVEPTEAGQPPTDPAARFAFDTNDVVNRTLELRSELAAPVLENPTPAAVASLLNTKVGRKGLTVLADMEKSIKALANTAKQEGVEYDIATARDAFIDTVATRTGVDPAALRQALLQDAQPANAKPTVVATTPEVAAALRTIPGVEVAGTAAVPTITVNTRAALEAVRANPAAANLDLAKAEEAIGKRIADAQTALEAFADGAVLSPKVRAAEAVGAQIDPAETIGLTIDTLAKSILKQAETAAAGMELASTRAAVDLIVERAAQQLSTRLDIDAAQVAQQIRQGIAERLVPRAAPAPAPAPANPPEAQDITQPPSVPPPTDAPPQRLGEGRTAQKKRPDPQTLTESFKRWFGNSKVVDADGNPLVVYHGTGDNIAAFDMTRIGSRLDSGFLGRGIYLTSNPATAGYYANAASAAAPNVMPLYASLQNPFMWGRKTLGVRGEVTQGSGLPLSIRAAVLRRAGFTLDTNAEPDFAAEPRLSAALRDELISRGYDGVIASLDSGLEIVAFRPEQLKSAIGNTGAFDQNNPDIRYMQEGRRTSRRSDSVTPQRLAELSAKARIDPDALTDLEIQDLVIGRMEGHGGAARSNIKITRFSPRGKVGRMIKALEWVFGRRVIGLEIEGAGMEGFTFHRESRLIFINPNAGFPIASVLAHEFAHTLESSNPALKARLNQIIGQALGREGLARYRQILDDDGRTSHEDYTPAERDWVAASETLADFVSDALSDGRLLARLYAKERGLFFEVVQKLREFLERVMNALRTAPQQVDTLGARVLVEDFAKLKSQIESAIASASEAGPATRIFGTTTGESQWGTDATRLPDDQPDLPSFIVEQRRMGADLVRNMNRFGQQSLEPEAETRTRMQKFADNWFDTAGPWYRLKVATTKAGIRTVANDVYEAMTRMIGEAGWNVKRDTEQVAQPMATLMQNGWRAKRSDTGFLNFWNVKTERDFIRTLGMVKYAQHAKERNATGRWLASTLEEDAAAERAEILTKYQNGLMSVEDARAEIADIMADPDNVIRENNAWSGLTDKQANEITEAADRYGLTEIVNQLNPFIKEATARTLGYQQQAGNLGARAKRLIDLYGWQNYVPVKGTEFSKDVDASSTFKPEMYIANNFESEVRLTGGRSSSLGAQIIGGVLGDMSRSAYTLSAQNVAKTVEQLAKDGGIPGAQLNRIVQRDTDENGRYLPLTAVKGKDGKVSYPSRGLIALHGDYATEIVLPDKNLITSLERMTRTLGFWGRFGAFANQTLGRLLTGLNWNFWLGALTIDAQATGFALLMKHGPKVAGRYVMNLGKQGLFLQSMRMAFMTNTQLEKAAARKPGGFYDYAHQLKKRGGIAFFGDSLGDPTAKYQGTEAQLAKLVGSKRWKELTFGLPAKAINGLLSIGEGFELAPRVAAYRAMVESGVDPREATSTTKDFMDFNKTGTYGSTAAAAYLFFRPAATGAITTVRQILDTPNGKKVAIGYAVASMMLYAATIGMMPDEERRKLSKDSLMRNTSFPDGEGGFFQIPEAYGMQRLMGGLGRVVAMVAQGDMEVAEGAFQVVNSIKENVSALPQTNVNPFRPGVDQTEEFKKLFVQLLPTLIRMAVQPGMNMTNQGTPLHIPDAWLGKRFAADAAKPNTPDVYSKLAQSILEGTGTSIDIYPETIKYWADTLGVMGQTINAMSYAQTDANKAGEALGVTDVLASTFGKKFLNRDRQFTPSVRYQNLVNILDRQAKQYERAQELGEPVTPDQRAAVSKVRQLRSQYQRMNKAIRDLPDGPVKEARREAISKWQEAEVERFNRENETRM